MFSPVRSVFPNCPSLNSSGISYRENIKFFVLNFLTLGIFGSCKNAVKEREHQALKQHQIYLMNEQRKIEKTIVEIEHEIQDLSKATTQPSEFFSVEQKIHAIAINHFSPTLPSLFLIKRLFLNIVTLGFHSCAEMNDLSTQVNQLKVENQFLSKTIQDRINTAKASLFSQIEVIKKIQNEQDFYAKIAKDKGSIQSQGQSIEQKHGDATKNLSKIKKEVQEKRIIVQNVVKTAKDVQSFSSAVNKKREQVTQARDLLKTLSAKVEMTQKIICDKKVGPFDRKIPLSGGQVIQANSHVHGGNNHVEFHPCYQGKRSAYEAMEASFEHAFEELIAFSKNKSMPIVFNKSAEIFTNPKCIMNMKALYRHMAAHLIRHSVIVSDHTLQINQEGLTIVSSCPENVGAYKSGSDVPETVVNFKHHDLFTPPGGKGLSKGIDPVLAKQVLLRLNEQQEKMLSHLLLEPLIPDTDEGLKQYQEDRKVESDEIRKVSACYELICDLGDAIELKFGPSFGVLWLDKADDYEEKPLIKEVEEVKIEEKKGEEIVEWIIDIESFKKVDSHFAQMVLDSQAHYKRIWANMSKSLLLNPYKEDTTLIPLNNQNFRQVLRQQFHVWYIMLQNHFCLMSSLCAITMTDPAQFTEANVTKIHHAMANHLDRPEVAKKFEKFIKEVHQMSVAQYQVKLRQNKILQFLGDCEISIFANLMGVCVTVFIPEDVGAAEPKLDEYGLQTLSSPAVTHFGPNTKERLYITYQRSGSNYYFTFPKLKTDVLSGDAGNSVKVVENYWNKVQHNEY